MAEYLAALHGSLPDLAASARGVGELLQQTAVEVQYAKIMIIVTEIWLAEQLVELAFWAPYLIPAVVGAARAVMRLLFQALERGLLAAVRDVLRVAVERMAAAWARIVPLMRSAAVSGLKFGAIGAGFEVGLGGLVQLGQMAAGDRTAFSWNSVASGVVMGFVGGGLAGVFHAALAPAGAVVKGLGKADPVVAVVGGGGKDASRSADVAGVWGAVKNSVRSAGVREVPGSLGSAEVVDAAGAGVVKGLGGKLGGLGRGGSGRAFVDTPLGQAAVWGPAGYLATEFSNAVYGDSASGAAGFLSGMVGGMAGARLGRHGGGVEPVGIPDLPGMPAASEAGGPGEKDGAASTGAEGPGYPPGTGTGGVPATTGTAPFSPASPANEVSGTAGTGASGAARSGSAEPEGAFPAFGARPVGGEGAGSVTGSGPVPATTAGAAGAGRAPGGLAGFDTVLHDAHNTSDPLAGTGTGTGVGTGTGFGIAAAAGTTSDSHAAAVSARAADAGSAPSPAAGSPLTETSNTVAGAGHVRAGGRGEGVAVTDAGHVRGGGRGEGVAVTDAGHVRGGGGAAGAVPTALAGPAVPVEGIRTGAAPGPGTETTATVAGISARDSVASGGGGAVGGGGGAVGAEPGRTAPGPTRPADGAGPGAVRRESAGPVDTQRAVPPTAAAGAGPAADSRFAPAGADAGAVRAVDATLSAEASPAARAAGQEANPAEPFASSPSPRTEAPVPASASAGGPHTGSAAEPVPGEHGRSAVETLVDRLVAERARQGDAAPSSHDAGVGAPLRRMTRREQEEWVERQVLAQGHGPGAGPGAEQVRMEARQFLRDLHRDLGASLPAPEGTPRYFSPAHSAPEPAASHAERWFGEQSRIAGEREAELAQAQRDAEQHDHLDAGFERWAVDRLGRGPSAETKAEWDGEGERGGEASALPHTADGSAPHPNLDGAVPAMPEERPGDGPAPGESTLPHERYGPTVAKVYQAAEQRLRQQLDDGGDGGLDNWPGLRDFLDRQWVTEHGVEQASLAVRTAFEQWRTALPPERRQWLDGWAEPRPGPGPRTGADRLLLTDRPPGDGEAGGAPVRAGTRAERMLEEAERTLERSVRTEMGRLLSRSSLASGPEPLIRGAGRAVAGLMDRGLRSRVTRLFERTEADERARNTAAGEFDAIAGRAGEPATGPERATGGDRVRELSEGGRERLRSEWLTEFDRDLAEIRGDLDSPRRSGAGQAEADRRWEEARAARQLALPDRIELQVAKEAAAHEATDAVREAAGTDRWRTALDGPGEAGDVFRREFGLDQRQADVATQRSAAYGLGSEMHARVDDWARLPDRDPDGVRQIIDDHTSSENVGRRLAAAVARRAAEDAARHEAAAMLTARAPGIAQDAAERFTDGHVARVTSLFDERFGRFTASALSRDTAEPGGPTHTPPPGGVDAAAVDAWRKQRRHLSDGLGRHLAFEADATDGLGLWARGTREAAAGRGVQDEEWDRIADTTRRDWFESFHASFGPEGLDTGDWLSHEATEGGRFRRDASTERFDGPGDSTGLSPIPGASPRDGEAPAPGVAQPASAPHTRDGAVGPRHDATMDTVSDHGVLTREDRGSDRRTDRPADSPTPDSRQTPTPTMRSGTTVRENSAASVRRAWTGVPPRPVAPGGHGQGVEGVSGGGGLSAAPLLPRGNPRPVDLVPAGASALADGVDWTLLHPAVRTFATHAEAVRWGRRYSEAHLSGLSERVQAAVWSYSRYVGDYEDFPLGLPYEANYLGINGFLRKEFQQVLETTLRNFEADESHYYEVELSDGLGASTAVIMSGARYLHLAEESTAERIGLLDQAFRPRGIPEPLVVHRVFGWQELDPKDLLTLKGRTFEERRFLSTTLSPTYKDPNRDSEDYRLHLFLPAGTSAEYIGPLSHFSDGEAELLLSRGQRWEVLHTEQDEDGVWHIFGRVLPRAVGSARDSAAASLPLVSRVAPLDGGTRPRIVAGPSEVRSQPVHAGGRVIGVSFLDNDTHRAVAGAHELLARATAVTHAEVEGGSTPRYRVLGTEEVPVPTGVNRYVIDAEGTPDGIEVMLRDGRPGVADVDLLLSVMQRDERYRSLPAEAVVLWLSCGSAVHAQELADRSGRTVWAPDSKLDTIAGISATTTSPLVLIAEDGHRGTLRAFTPGVTTSPRAGSPTGHPPQADTAAPVSSVSVAAPPRPLAPRGGASSAAPLLPRGNQGPVDPVPAGASAHADPTESGGRPASPPHADAAVSLRPVAPRGPGHDSPPMVAVDAPEWVRDRIRYMREAVEFERRLGAYLADHKGANDQVGRLVQAVWERAVEAGRWQEFGSDDNTMDGVVGTSRERLQAVVDSGNLRERMGFLYVGRFTVSDLLGTPEDHPPAIAAERRDPERNRSEAALRYEAAPKAPEGAAVSDLRAAGDALRVSLAADDVRPPLSEGERALMPGGRRTWFAGGKLWDLPMAARLQWQAEGTGGLVSAAASATSARLLRQALDIRDRWHVEVDPALLRLALLGTMLPLGHHTFHEIMLGLNAARDEMSVKHRDVLEELQYFDNWGRYWNIAPLTEQELRRHVARDGRFPDEHALTLPRPAPEPSAPARVMGDPASEDRLPVRTAQTHSDAFAARYASRASSRPSATPARDIVGVQADGLPNVHGRFFTRAGGMDDSSPTAISRSDRAGDLPPGFRRPRTDIRPAPAPGPRGLAMPIPMPFAPRPGISPDALVRGLLYQDGRELGIHSPDAMIRYVLHLADSADLDDSVLRWLVEVAVRDARAGSAQQLRAYQAELALLKDVSQFFDAHGNPGRDWTYKISDPDADMDVARPLRTDAVMVPDPRRSRDQAADSLVKALWHGPGRVPYSVRATYVADSRAVAAWSSAANRWITLSHEEFANLLSADLVLSGREATDIVLAASYMGDGDLELPRLVADRTGRDVWAYTEELSFTSQLDGDVLVMRPHEDERSRRSPGVWARSRPGELPAGYVSRQPGGLTYQTFPLVDWQGTPFGRSFISNAERRGIEASSLRVLAEMTRYRLFYPGDSNSRNMYQPLNGVRTRSVPWPTADRPSYALDLHGNGHLFRVIASDGMNVRLSAKELVHNVLRHRPSFKRPRPAAKPGQPAPKRTLVLTSCLSGEMPPNTDPDGPRGDPLRVNSIAQELMNEVREWFDALYAPNGEFGILWDKISEPFYVEGGDTARMVEFRPMPGTDRLEELAEELQRRQGGVHPTPETLLALVKFLRYVFTAGVDDRPDYLTLLEGAWAVERMRLNDPAQQNLRLRFSDLERLRESVGGPWKRRSESSAARDYWDLLHGARSYAHDRAHPHPTLDDFETRLLWGPALPAAPDPRPPLPVDDIITFPPSRTPASGPQPGAERAASRGDEPGTSSKAGTVEDRGPRPGLAAVAPNEQPQTADGQELRVRDVQPLHDTRGHLVGHVSVPAGHAALRRPSVTGETHVVDGPAARDGSRAFREPRPTGSNPDAARLQQALLDQALLEPRPPVPGASLDGMILASAGSATSVDGVGRETVESTADQAAPEVPSAITASGETGRNPLPAGEDQAGHERAGQEQAGQLIPGDRRASGVLPSPGAVARDGQDITDAVDVTDAVAPAQRPSGVAAPLEELAASLPVHWYGTRPVVVSLFGDGDGAPALDPASVQGLARTVPGVLLLYGRLDGDAFVLPDGRRASLDTVAATLAMLPAERPPVLLMMPGGDAVAQRLATTLGVAVTGARGGVEVVPDEGRLRAGDGGQLLRFDPGAEDAAGRPLELLDGDRWRPGAGLADAAPTTAPGGDGTTDPSPLPPAGPTDPLVAPEPLPARDTDIVTDIGGDRDTGADSVGDRRSQQHPADLGQGDAHAPSPSDAPSPSPDPTSLEARAADPRIRSIGVPKAGLPHVAEVVAQLRAWATELGYTVPEEVWNRLPQWLLSNYPFLLSGERPDRPEGLLVLLGPVEALVTLDPRQPAPVANPAGSVDGPDQVPAGGDPGSFRATAVVNATYATGVHVQSESSNTGATRLGVSLNFGVGLPSPVAHLLSIGAGISGVANQSGRTTTHIADSERGHVEDNRAGATLVSYKPNWSLRLRPVSAQHSEWRNVTARPVEGPESQRLLLWVPKPYLEAGGEDQAVATGEGVLRNRLPATYFASGVIGLPTLYDGIAHAMEEGGVPLSGDARTHDELIHKLWNLPSFLDHAVNGDRRTGDRSSGDRGTDGTPRGGYTFRLHDKYGRTVATVTVHAIRLDPGREQQVGATSDTAHLENVRIAIDGAGGEHRLGHSSTLTPLTAGLDLTPRPHENSDAGLGVSGSLSVAWSNGDALGATRTGLWVMVPRFAGVTVAYRAAFMLQARVTLRHEGADRVRATGLVESQALLRLPLPEAFRHGFPVERSALHDAAATGPLVPYDPAALRGGPTPEQRQAPDRLPRHLRDDSPYRGIGMGLVEVPEETADHLFEVISGALRAHGFLLPGDQENPIGGRSRWRLSSGLESRVDNEDLLHKFLLDGLAVHHDRLHGDGLTLVLHRRRGFAGMEFDVDAARITISAERSRPIEFLDRGNDHHLTNLAMGMDSASVGVSGGKTVSLTLRARGMFRYLLGGASGVGLSAGKGASESAFFLNNRPELLESGSAEFLRMKVTSTYTVTIEFQHSGLPGKVRTGRRDPAALVVPDQPAIVRVLPLGDGAQGTAAGRDDTRREVLDQAVIFHLDSKGLRGALNRLLPSLDGPQGRAARTLDSMAATLRAHMKEAVFGGYTTDQPFDNGLLRDTFAALDVKAKLGPSEFLGASTDPFVQGVIKLWLSQATTTTSASRGLTWIQADVTVGGVSRARPGSAADGSDQAGHVEPILTSGGVGMSRRWQHNTAESFQQAAAKELIQLSFSNVYLYGSKVDLTLTKLAEKHGKLMWSARDYGRETLVGREMLYLLPEPEALALYADGDLPVSEKQLTSAMERWADGSLKLPANTVARLLARWRPDASVGQGSEPFGEQEHRAEPSGGHRQPTTHDEP
ncbi:lonely Cys domain-containing protein, partial [Streptomyces mirabilis]|uniref:lonely Cys domain-containing protein n=1 Tax=Streptomyces mirabilis TaxID=68239 RepID=UPI0036629B68